MEEKKINQNPVPDKELDRVAGGYSGETSEVHCPNCKEVTPSEYISGLHAYRCLRCGVTHHIQSIIPGHVINTF